MNLRPHIFTELLLLVVFLFGCTSPEPPAFDAARVIAHVEKQCSYGPRLPNSAARDSAAAYIARALEGYGATVSLQSFRVPDPYGGQPLRLINVIASFDPERERRVLLCAHYDSRPWADQDPDSTRHGDPVPAAVDGAAGAGILIEMGRLVGARRPDGIGVDLVFFDGEDYGKEGDLQHYLLGSKHFASNLAGYRPEKAILLDMVGGVDTQIGRERYSQENAAALNDTLFARAAELGLDYFVDHVGPPIVDDHVPLLRAGIEAVDLFGYDYPYWHTVDDTPDKCSPELLGQAGRLLVDFLYRYPFD
jgi:glutaminyl-peptide cyclotransferase